MDAAWGMAFPAKLANEARYVFVLDGYFDESGTSDGSETITVAGFLAHFNAWREFESEWNAALTEYGLTTRPWDYFHMTDFVARVGPYATWSEDERKQRLTHLVDLILKYTLSSYGVSLPKKVFESVFTDKARSVVGGAYGFAAMQCLLSVSADMEMLPVETAIAYIFEDGAQGKGEFMAAWDSLKRLPGGTEAYHGLSLKFEDKRKFVPLQASDILAWELFRERVNQDGPQDPLHRMPYRRFRAETTSTLKHMKARDIKAFAAIVNGMAEQ
jgi:hypothetical protein